MVKQTNKNSIPHRSSRGLTRAAADVEVPGHPSTSGLQVDQPTKRQKYTADENRAIMACYYNSKPEKRGYLKRMYELWKQQHPDSNVSEQRLADQRRFILRNKVFSEVELGEIQENCKIKKITSEVEIPDPQDTNENTVVELPETAAREEITTPPPEIVITEPTEELTQKQKELKDKIMEHITSNEERLRLPPLKTVPKKILAPIMEMVNAVLPTIDTGSILETNQLMYSAAVIVTNELGIKIKSPSHTMKKASKPKWKIRLEQKIKKLRADASNLKNMHEQRLKNRKIIDQLTRRYRLDTRNINEAVEIVKQQITATARKIERYDARVIQYKQNQQFQSDQRRFYQSLNVNSTMKTEKPEKGATVEFWKELWENPKNYNKDAKWIYDFEKSIGNKQMQVLQITTEMVKNRVKKVKNWTSPGNDQLHGFWLKYLTSLHAILAKQLNEILQTGQIDEWLTTGKTYLIQKDAAKGTTPGNYRPITCLPTTFKLLTGIIADNIMDYLETNNILPVEQKGNKRKSRGTKDQLLIDKMILENCKNRKTNLNMVWIDYKKAFDSLPHSWIIKCLEITGISKNITSFTEKAMKQWRTELAVGNENYGMVNIKRGIFQGDSLSPLLFIIAMIPLSVILRKMKLGYQTAKDAEKISHLLYMDDLKLYGKSEIEIQSLTNTVRVFSTDISMQFGLEKCATVSMKKGKITACDGIEMPNGQLIKCNQNEAYKYLGILQLDNIKHGEVKTIVRREYTNRVRKILKSKLNGGNTIKAINTWAIPVIRYTAGIVNWTQADLDILDRKTRKLMTMHYSLHPRGDTDRLYLPRKSGGRGLLQVKQTVEEEKHALADYLKESQEHLLIEVKNRNLLKAQQTKQEYRKNVIKSRMESWQNKALHGQFLEKIKDKVDSKKTWLWLTTGTLKKETESLILAAQEQSIRTNAIKAKIEKSSNDATCRLCKEADETIDHILSCCKKIAQTDYKLRHNSVAQMIHWNLCKNYNIKTATNWWEHKPEKITENQMVKILWDFRIQTDKVLAHNTPDITLVEKNKVTIIDIAIPGDSRVDEKEHEKIAKYQDLKIEIQRLWHKPAVVIPVVIGTLGAIPKALELHLKQLKIDKITISQMQKATLLGSARILRKYITTS